MIKRRILFCVQYLIFLFFVLHLLINPESLQVHSFYYEFQTFLKISLLLLTIVFTYLSALMFIDDIWGDFYIPIKKRSMHDGIPECYHKYITTKKDCFLYWEEYFKRAYGISEGRPCHFKRMKDIDIQLAGDEWAMEPSYYKHKRIYFILIPVIFLILIILCANLDKTLIANKLAFNKTFTHYIGQYISRNTFKRIRILIKILSFFMVYLSFIFATRIAKHICFCDRYPLIKKWNGVLL